MIKSAAHPDTAQGWLAFIRSPGAIKIFENDSFEAYAGDPD